MCTIKFVVSQGSVLSPVLFAVYLDDIAKCSKYDRHLHIILYASGSLLLAPTGTELENELTQHFFFF